MDRTILHCDCNSFFASVETLLDPSLADGPTAVCGDPESRHGIILAKNEKAKAFGVQTAETIWLLNKGFKALKTIRLIRTFRVLRIFKSFRYSKNIQIIIQVGKNSKDALITVLYLAIGYIIVCALVIFNVEPDSFHTFFDAIYWATISLTTVGYGDIYPITTLGRMITMVSSFMGIAIVALPAGIITAGYMKEIGSV